MTKGVGSGNILVTRPGEICSIYITGRVRLSFDLQYIGLVKYAKATETLL
jgi:hypothetical protein